MTGRNTAMIVYRKNKRVKTTKKRVATKIE